MTYKTLTTQEWIEKVQQNASVLREFVGNWHPSARFPEALQQESVLLMDGDAVAVPQSFPITAPAAELACQNVRQMIRKEEPNDPVTRFDQALAKADIGEIMSLLEGAWFGVPESTSCWGIKGFSLAVDLMDDPPDQPEEK